MANTDIDICSQALTLLRAEPISSFDDGSNEADICNSLYLDYIKHLLTSYPWTFATKKALLSREDVTPTNEYKYVHIVPAEALLIWAVFNSSAVGAQPVRDYDIYASDGGRRIYSNHEILYADYTVYTSEANFPPYFWQFAVNAFASHIAMPVTHNAELVSHYHQLAFGSPSNNLKGGLFGVAASTDSKQKRNEFMSTGLQDQIRKIMLDNRLPAETPQPKTAFEIAQRMKEFQTDIGAAYGRAMTEFITPLFKRIIGILSRKGLLQIPEGFNIDNFFIKVQITSPIAQVQKLDDLNRFMQGYSLAAQINPMIAMGSYKVEDIPVWINEMTASPSKLLRPEEEKQALTQQVAQIIAQMQAEQQGVAQ